MGNLRHLAYFVAAVKTGWFTAAAEPLGITKTVVSQQVARLTEPEQIAGFPFISQTALREHLPWNFSRQDRAPSGQHAGGGHRSRRHAGGSSRGLRRGGAFRVAGFRDGR